MNELLLEKLFGSRLRVTILSLLFSRQGEEFYPGEVARLIKEDRGNTSRELLNLEQIGIIRGRKDKKHPNRIYYGLNQEFPLAPEIKSIYLKSTGAEGVLKEALASVKGIDYAFIYGSVAAGNEGPTSDIDLFIVGSIALEDLSKALRHPEQILRRDINPSLYTLKEFKNRARKADPFISRLIDEPRILIIGDADELQKLIR
jgi:uncharacterized protein